MDRASNVIPIQRAMSQRPTQGPSPKLPNGSEFSLRIFAPLREFVLEKYGTEALRQIAESASLTLGDVANAKRWVSLEQIEALFEATASLVGGDEFFAQACVHNFGKGTGPVRLVLGVVSPVAAYHVAARLFPTVATASSLAVRTLGRNHLELEYTPGRPEGRLMCLSRMAPMRLQPTLWGLPPAELLERSCVARGDPTCIYEIRVFEAQRLVPAIVGGALGAAAAWALSSVAPASIPSLAIVALPVASAALAYALELRRSWQRNLVLAEQTTERLRDLWSDDAEARREIMELHARQREWADLMESHVQERTQALQAVVARAQGLQQGMTSKVRGMSHDLKSPLQVLKALSDVLRRSSGHTLDPEIIEEQESAVAMMERLVKGLLDAAQANAPGLAMTPERLVIAELTDRLRRRLKALAHGRDVRTNVFANREAPSEISIDPVVFDRVVDNLMSNAVKYTDRGIITLEVGGTPGFLTLKMSDTGRGIAEGDIERVFQPGGSDASGRAADSYGVGLSVVVYLLGQVGGRLEIMSKPGVGTTFWAHFPLAPPATALPPDTGPHELQKRVVTIRKVDER